MQFGSVLGFSKNENFKFQNHKKCKHRILKIWIFHHEMPLGSVTSVHVLLIKEKKTIDYPIRVKDSITKLHSK